MYPNHNTYEDQRHSGHRHHTVVDVACIIDSLRNNLEAQQRATAQELTYTTHDDQDQRVAETVAHTVEERRPRLVLHGEASKRPIRIQLVMIRPT